MGATAIINKTIHTIETYESTLGVGTPVSGDIFDTSATEFIQAIQTQASAVTGDNWLGTAAETYSAKSQSLQDFEQIMADADYTTSTLISDQVGAVEKARDTLEDWVDFLEDCKPYAKVLYYNPLTILESYVFQAVVSATAMIAVIIALVKLTITTIENAQTLIEKLENIAGLLAELPSDIAADLESLIDSVASSVESGVSVIASDVTSEVSEAIANLKSEIADLKSGLSDLTGTTSLSDLSSSLSGISSLPDLSSALSDIPSLSDLSSGLSSLSGLADSSPLSALSSLPGLSVFSGTASASGLSSLTGSTPSSGLLARLTAFTNTGTTGSPTTGVTTSAAAPGGANGSAADGMLPTPLARRLAKNTGDGASKDGAAAGTADTQRVPVTATNWLQAGYRRATSEQF